MSDRKNSEGYSDPTAYQAMMNLEIEELRFKKLLRSIKDLCDLADFEIEGRVVLIDKRYGGRKMFSFDEFEDMCEKLAEAWQQILMPFKKLSEVLEEIYNDPAPWPKRNCVTPKKYGLSLQKKHLHKPFTPYQYIPITPKNLPYMRRTF